MRIGPLPLLMLAACTPGAPDAAAPARQVSPERLPSAPVATADVAAGVNAFAVRLYGRLRGEPGNLFVSPVGIAGAFGPVLAGAQDETRREMADALGLPTDAPSVHPALGALLRSLERAGPGATVSIADALWVQRGFQLRDPFVDTAEADYGARVEALDLVGAPAPAADRINAWVSAETRGRIPRLVSPDMFNADSRLVVTNAVHFLADWASPFRGGTAPAPFHLDGGGTVPVPLMTQRGRFAAEVVEEDGVALLDLPYKGPRLSMTVVLPTRRGGLGAVEAALTPERLTGWLRRLDGTEPGDIRLFLPKFTMETAIELGPPLQALGMRRAFDRVRAQLGGIAPARLHVARALQKTYLRVDELGTEAAAATGVLVEIVSRPAEFRADHPFLFVIRDKRAGSILFMGRLSRPAPGG